MLSYNGRELVFGQFPNGESNLKHIKIDERDTTHVVTLKYENDSDLFQLLLVRNELNEVEGELVLRITYAPYSRMDRDSDTYVFSLKTFAEYINWMNWDKVVIYEPHSDVLPALLERVQVVNIVTHPIMQAKVNVTVGSTVYQLFYPDAGAQKRYAGFESGSPELDKWRSEHELIGMKKRDFATGKILEYDIYGERAPAQITAVILDDLCSKGGTFILAAQKLREIGFKKIILVVAHCENTVFYGQLFSSGLIDHMITTDSIPRLNATNQMTVVPLSEFRWT